MQRSYSPGLMRHEGSGEILPERQLLLKHMFRCCDGYQAYLVGYKKTNVLSEISRAADALGITS